MKSDVLDIIFENRNKAYGAYVLRKFYPDRIKFSLAAMFIAASVLSAFTFIDFKDKRKEELDPMTTVLGIIAKEPKIIPQETPKTKSENTPAKPSAKFNNNILIVPNDIPTDVIPDDLGKSNIGKGTTDIKEGEEGKGSGSSGGEKGIETKVEEVIDPNIPLDIVDIEPSYPGGTAALRKFLEKNLINPTDMESGEEVAVNIRFVVGYDGKLKSFIVTKSGGDEFDNEVIRVLKKMPQWNPGRSHGKDVSVYTTIPVKFISPE